MRLTLHIKNMVCPRCIEAVTETLTDNGAEIKSIELGLADIEVNPDQWITSAVAEALTKRGFTLLEDPDMQKVQQVKSLVIDLIFQKNSLPPIKLSAYLSESLGFSYSYLSRLFSQKAGMTIEKFVIAQKVERAKELLSYRELATSDIADQLGYKSISHFSQQFKREVGLSPTMYQQTQEKGRLPLDQI